MLKLSCCHVDRVVNLLECSQNRAQLAYEVRFAADALWLDWTYAEYVVDLANCLQLTFILWTLAFCDEALEKFAAANALDAIVLQVAAAPREKVVRVALEALQV